MDRLGSLACVTEEARVQWISTNQGVAPCETTVDLLDTLSLITDNQSQENV